MIELAVVVPVLGLILLLALAVLQQSVHSDQLEQENYMLRYENQALRSQMRYGREDGTGCGALLLVGLLIVLGLLLLVVLT